MGTRTFQRAKSKSEYLSRNREADRTTHEAELKTMARIFADVKTTDEVMGMVERFR